MKCSFVVLVIVTYVVNVYCVLISSGVPANLSSVQKDTHLEFTAETHPHKVNIVRTRDNVRRKKTRIQDAQRKRRNVKNSDIIYFPGETNARTTTNKPIVPVTVIINNRFLIRDGYCPIGYKSLGSWCVPDERPKHDYY